MKAGGIILVGLLVWAILASSLAAYFYVEYVAQVEVASSYRALAERCEEIALHVSILIDYGNGSRVWFNDTLVPIGSSLLNATMMVERVEYMVGDYGAFITSIGGVANDPGRNLYWIYWVWDSSRGEWVLGPVAADKYRVSDGGVYAWTYSDTSSWPPPPPGG